nr:adenylate/guanylate cyclase domain-containing protein [Candidatus Gracilibacteria bacterium]
MNKNIWKNKNFLAVFLASIIFLVIFIGNIIIFHLFDKNLQSFYYQVRDSFKEGNVSRNIAVVEIDEKTLTNLGRFPFDRKVYVNLIKNLNKAGATVIGFDIIFADKSDLMSDSYFAKSINEAKNIVLGGDTLDGNILEKPLSSFLESALILGYFTPNIDTKTNTVYSSTHSKQFRNGLYEYFPISLLRAFYSFLYNDKSYLTNKAFIADNSFVLNKFVKIPLSKNNDNDILINFVSRNKFERFSFFDIYDDKQFSLQQSFYGDKFLKDKIVLVGAAAKGIKDNFNTPFGIEYGVYIHANFLNTVLTSNYLKYFNEYLEWFLIFLLTILAVYINFSKGGYFLLLTNLSIFTIFLIIFPSIIVSFTNLVLNFPFELFISFLLSLLLSNIVKYLIENKDKTKLNKALSEYVSKDIAAEILSGSGTINLDGEKKRMAIFFSDIEGFTTISENFTPEELISFLKDYLNEMSKIIMDQKGLINKYEGDAIMALWGVFTKTTENISYEACDTALIQKQKLAELNKKWESVGLPKITIRIGINTGDAIIGNIGSKGRKMEFTAIGDNVNLASRLEGINKFYGTYFCVSEIVYNDTKDFFEYRYLDKIRVKGKNNAVNIYELLDYKGKLTKLEKDIYIKFQEGIDLYLKKKFDQAGIIFEELAKLGDKPSRVYKDRCDDFIKAPIEDWDGIWTMQEK